MEVDRMGEAPDTETVGTATGMPRRWIAWAVVLLLLRCVALGLSVSDASPLDGDEPFYDDLARSLLAGQGYARHGEPSVMRPPGWPLLLAGIRLVLGEGRRPVVVAQGVFDAGSILLTAWLAGRLFRSRRAAGIAFVGAFLWPPFFRESRMMQTEPLFTLLVVATLAACWGFVNGGRASRALLTGALGGAAGLVRPSAVLLLGGLGLGWLVLSRASLQRTVRSVAAVIAGIALVVAPWAIRNFAVFHAFIPYSLGSGTLFYLGADPETGGRWMHGPGLGPARRVLAEEEARRGRALTLVEQDRVLFAAGLDIIRRHPLESAAIAGKRLWRFVFLPVVGPTAPILRVGFFIVLCALYALALPRGLEGFGSRDPHLAFRAMLLVAAGVVIAGSTVFYATSRFAEPFRPIWILLASGTVAGWLDQARPGEAGARGPGATDSLVRGRQSR